MKRRRWLTVAALVLMIWILSNPNWVLVITYAYSAESVGEIAEYLRSFGLFTPSISIALMILQAVIAPLPSSLVAGANGVVFGVYWGSLVSWTGALAGAVVSFWLARALGKEVIGRWVAPRHLSYIDRLSELHGFWIVLVARLTPIISLDFIGYLAGLSRMRFGQYMLANMIGIAPGMVAYTILGHDLAMAQASIWRVSMILLGGVVLYLVGRWWLSRQDPGGTMDTKLKPGSRARVVREHQAADRDPLVIKAGEALSVGQHDTRWPAYVWCSNQAGEGGWVPEQYLDRDGDRGVARCDYSAAELSVVGGEEVLIEKEAGGWFWVRNQSGQEGWVPAEHIELLA